MKNNWASFVKRISVKADKQKIYESWATTQGIESWFLSKALFYINGKLKTKAELIEKGDTYRWHWYGWPDFSEEGKITDTNGRDFFQFTFTGNCLVTVRIIEEAGETLVELTQENIPPDDDPATNLYVGCGTGWTFYLTNLKSMLEGGIDLRNKNDALKNVINS